MAIDNRGIKQSSAFNLRTALPLDLRTVRQTLLERNDIPLQYRYEGMKCYVLENETIYHLKGGVDNINWVPECCIKYNLEAIANPTINDNEGDGYTAGSIWRNEIDDSIFILTNFEPNGDANWLQISGEFNWIDVLW